MTNFVSNPEFKGNQLSTISIVTDKATVDAITDPIQGQEAFAQNEGQFGLGFWYDGTKWRPKNNQLVWAKELSASGTFDSDADLGVGGIPDYFRSLFIVAFLRSTTASSSVGVSLQFNGDSTAGIYNKMGVRNNVGTVEADNEFSTNKINVGVCPGSTNISNLFGIGEFVISNYAGPTRKQVSGRGTSVSSSVGNSFTRVGGGLYESNNAITRIELTDTYEANSSIEMYGLDGA